MGEIDRRRRRIITETVEQYLFDTADPEPTTEPRVTASGGITGVALPEKGPIAPGAILHPEYARRLGAQLIREADLHDAILDTAWSQRARQAQRAAQDDPRGEADR